MESFTGNVKVTDSKEETKTLRQLLKEAFSDPRFNAAKGKELVLVIGDSGAGKSTSVNYLMGNEMVKDESETIVVSERENTQGDNIPVIGKDVASQTVHPQIYQTKKMMGNEEHRYHFADAPGFNDNRGPQYISNAAITTKMTIQASDKIRGILVVIRKSAFNPTNRGREFFNVIKTLQELLTNYGSEKKLTLDDVKNSVVFLVSHTDSDGKKTTTCIDNFKRSLLNSKQESQRALAPYCDWIKESFIEVDPLDNGESGTKILERLSKAKGIAKNSFGFPAQADTKANLTDFLMGVAYSGIQIISELVNKPREIKELEDNKNNEERRAREIAERITQLEQVSSFSTSEGIQAGLAAIRNQIADCEANILRANNELKNVERSIRSFQNELNMLDTNDPVEHWSEYWDEHKEFGVVKVYKENKHIFAYNGLPYLADKTSRQFWGEQEEKYNRFEDDNSNMKPNEGKYKTTYITAGKQYGHAEVRIKVAKKLVPYNATRITWLKEQLSIQKEEKRRLEGIVTNNTNSIELLREQERLLNGQQELQAQSAREARDRMLTQLRDAKTATENEIRRLETAIENAKRALTKAEEEIIKHVDEFELATLIAPVIEIHDQKPMSEFLADYAKLKNNPPESLSKTLPEAVKNLAFPVTYSGSQSSTATTNTTTTNQSRSDSTLQNSSLFSKPTTSSLPNITGLEYRRVPGDGNCLFYALRFYVSQTPEELRHSIAERLRGEDERLAQDLDLGSMTLNDYLRNLEHSNQWADHVEIVVLMRLLQRPIVIVGPEGTIRNRGDYRDYDRRQAIFVYYNGRDHYDALLKTEGYQNRAEEILNHLESLTQNRQNVSENSSSSSSTSSSSNAPSPSPSSKLSI